MGYTVIWQSSQTHAEEIDLVLMVDGYHNDVWFQLSLITLIKRFEELRTPQVVMGVEIECWPNDRASFACT